MTGLLGKVLHMAYVTLNKSVSYHFLCLSDKKNSSMTYEKNHVRCDVYGSVIGLFAHGQFVQRTVCSRKIYPYILMFRKNLRIYGLTAKKYKTCADNFKYENRFRVIRLG